MSNPIQDMIEEVNQQAAEPTVPESLSSNEVAQEHALTFLKKLYLEDGLEELIPQWIIVAGNNHIVELLTPFEGSESKDLTALGLRRVMAEVHAKRYLFMSEAWVVSRNSLSDINGRPPSQCEDRIEVVVVVAGDHDETTSKTYELIRDWESGKVIELKDTGHDHAGGTLGGRFAGMLE